jgi:hypothetical protein
MSDFGRPTLGPFMSLLCFQYLRVGTEEVADRAPVVASGRQRGYDLVEGLGLLGSTTDNETIRVQLNEALGVNGTKCASARAPARQARSRRSRTARSPWACSSARSTR